MPVSIPYITHVHTLYIVLFTGKIPHKITHVHPPNLVGHGKLYIFAHGRGPFPVALLVFAYLHPVCIIIGTALIVALVPHAWKQMHIGRCINVFYFSSVLFVFTVAFNIGFSNFCVFGLCSKILAI